MAEKEIQLKGGDLLSGLDDGIGLINRTVGSRDWWWTKYIRTGNFLVDADNERVDSAPWRMAALGLSNEALRHGVTAWLMLNRIPGPDTPIEKAKSVALCGLAVLGLCGAEALREKRAFNPIQEGVRGAVFKRVENNPETRFWTSMGYKMGMVSMLAAQTWAWKGIDENVYWALPAASAIAVSIETGLNLGEIRVEKVRERVMLEQAGKFFGEEEKWVV